MIWFIIEIIILCVLGNKMMVLLFDDSVENIRINFYEYILCAIPFSILLLVTMFTGYYIFYK